MTLQQLKYLTEIVKYGSMNEASQRMYISQPSLSSAVKELERELGFSLFQRTNRGISLSAKGSEFLGYARQVVEQTELLEEKFLKRNPSRRLFAVSAQHYAFVVNAFVNLVRNNDQEKYEFTLRETKTYEIIEDVKNLRSDLGVLYMSRYNEKIITNTLKSNDLVFEELFCSEAYAFISRSHPLANRESIRMEELDPYPYIYFEQGSFNSFYYYEEILSDMYHPKSISVSDRATLFNFLIGLNGYTLSTGILSEDLNGNHIVSVRLENDEVIRVGYITHKGANLSPIAGEYIEKLKAYIREYSSYR